MRDDEDEVDVAEPEDAGNVEVADDDLQRPATDGASEREGEDGERMNPEVGTADGQGVLRRSHRRRRAPVKLDL